MMQVMFCEYIALLSFHIPVNMSGCDCVNIDAIVFCYEIFESYGSIWIVTFFRTYMLESEQHESTPQLLPT